MKLLTWMSTYGPALIPFFGLTLVVTGIAIGVCDAVIGGLVLSVLLSFGESVTYTMLACLSRESDHARPYSFMAGANWTTTIVLAMLLLSTLGFSTPIPTMTHAENGLSPRSHERSQALNEIESLRRFRKVSDETADARVPVLSDETSCAVAAKSPGASVSEVSPDRMPGQIIVQ